eukprot:TRINITY_DN15115_c0_g1_i1.p1 TRINITY_DN15115_c0_g1~~TRINITY_DN15115_c0_g1_i1.p1  ORF type:complete len:299 (+),score=50.05 TRINITY_DN15115_c0_g1_i1:190-1086(+)
MSLSAAPLAQRGLGGGGGTFVTAPRGQGSSLGLLEVTLVAFVPWFLFVVTSILFTYAYHHHHVIVWMVLSLLFIISLSRARTARYDNYKSRFYIASLSAVALLLATVIGLSCYTFCLRSSWFYDSSYAYVNVLPSSAAAGYADAGKLAFADNARLDSSRAMGFKDVVTHCVAPIIDDDPGAGVQFWAAGVNCCGKRGSFECDDAWDSQARSGLVVADRLRLFDNQREQYMKAVRQAEAAYHINSAPEPIFVRWVLDPEQVEQNLWAIGVGVLVVACAAHLVFSCVAAGMLQNGGKGLY